jgi:histidinol-phosphate/aromatic aminotransferase/cobyric acid decarboxylase-like protein
LAEEYWFMLEHGGKLRRIAGQTGIPAEQWLDLSTGISPFPYPLSAPPAECWQRLPEDDDGLLESARAYYGVDNILPLAGSQTAIQTIPSLIPQGKVAMVATTYAEHPHAWEKHGHTVERVREHALLQVADVADVVVVCNPNNPTGMMLSRATL